MGNALSHNQIMDNDPAVVERVKQQFNTVIAENEMKWSEICSLAFDAVIEVAERFKNR